ncbi:MAG: hypothetical protein ABI688_01430 [Bacteroidota bacterium]
MKRFPVLPVLFCLLASCTATAQTADDIILKNITARGGYAKIKALRSIVFEGSSTSQGKPVAVKVYYDHLKAMKTEYTILGKTAYTILTTKGGWNYNPFGTDKVPVAMQDNIAKDGLFQLDIQGLFVDYKAKGYKASYEGKDTAAGKNCFKIKLVKAGEGDKIYLFDESYLLLKSIAYRLSADGKYVPGTNYYYDYRRNTDGYLFSYRRVGGTTTTQFDKVTTNTTIPASVFIPGN